MRSDGGGAGLVFIQITHYFCHGFAFGANAWVKSFNEEPILLAWSGRRLLDWQRKGRR